MPNITKIQEQKRRDFCTQFNVPEFFENVFLTDESTFQLHRNTIKVWSSKRLPHPVKKVPKFSQKIMIWGALSTKGFFLHIYNNNETVNAEKYRKTLSDFIPYANQLYPLGWFVEQDGATPHTSSRTQEFLSDNNVQVLQSPPNSPDLWTIENVWEIFKHNVEKKKPKSLDELRSYVWECRELLNSAMRNNLIDATYKRFTKCVENDGKLVTF